MKLNAAASRGNIESKEGAICFAQQASSRGWPDCLLLHRDKIFQRLKSRNYGCEPVLAKQLVCTNIYLDSEYCPDKKRRC
jgi:hypothetical protein|eukprot:COSAG06_NODE_2872_length_6143_cov_2.234088_4_plen_80_part_00